MASTEDNGEEVSLSIRFVLPRGKTETTCSEDLGYAFDQAQDNGLNPSWIDEEDSLNVNPGKTVGILLAFLPTHFTPFSYLTWAQLSTFINEI